MTFKAILASVCQLSALILAVTGCADFSRGERIVVDGGPSVSDTGDGGESLSFNSDILPVLLSRCESCHNSGGSASNTSFVLTGEPALDYELVRDLVTPKDPAASRLLGKARGQGHGGGAVLTTASADYQLILTWIRDGAQP